ncbi:MAG TPA: YceI family protein [Polyangia bacterium]|jgi:hypothetical protein|nr:YceI family protein [Polyangia bacterium]
MAWLGGLVVAAVMMIGGRREATGASQALAFTLAPGASLELDGDSTLHHYSAKAHGMKIDVSVDDARVVAAGKSSELEALIRGHVIKTFELTVPVNGLASGEKGLDANMRKALKGDLYKDIRFRMESYEVAAPVVGATTFKIVLHGRLSLAGVERHVDVDAVGARSGAGVRLTGSKDLLMTDYQIKPPTMMLGTIKTANLITVKFDATLRNGASS